MENIIDVLKKYHEYETFIEQLSEAIQEILLAGGFDEDGDWHKIQWKKDIPLLLADIRRSLQELLAVIYAERSRLNI